MKTERLSIRLNAEKKTFLDSISTNNSAAIDRIMDEYVNVKKIIFREIQSADIRLDEKDIAVLCDPELHAAHPSDYINTMYYVALKHDHLAGAVHAKMDALSPSARYILTQDARHLTQEEMAEKYVV